MITNKIQWTPAVAKCCVCGRTYRMALMVYGHKHPLAPDDHYCRKCARKLGITDSPTREEKLRGR